MESLIKLPSVTDSEKENIKTIFELTDSLSEEIAAFTRNALINHPEMGTLIQSTPIEVSREQNKRSRELFLKIINEDNWAPYVENLLMQGEMYAKMGLSYGAWFDALKAYRTFITPILIDRFMEKKQLVEMFNTISFLIDIAMSYVGEAYIREKKRIIEEQRDKQAKLVKELESFAYIISHDLKAPLRGIATLTDWVVEDYQKVLDEKGKESLGLLKNRVSRMSNLIDGVLQYSRVGRFNTGYAEVDANVIVNEVIDLLTPPETMEIKIVNTLPVVFFNKASLSQLFENLIGNAIKYIDKVPGKILITSKDNDREWLFSVEDNGPGIEEKYFSKIFEIFQTLNARDEVESTGIGLTIVKKITETAGGKVWLESVPGKGTIFYFTLPK